MSSLSLFLRLLEQSFQALVKWLLYFIFALLSLFDDGLSLCKLFVLGVFNWGVYVDDKSHEDVDDHISGHNHEREEVGIGHGLVLDSKVELIPDELPVVEQHHREQCDEPGGKVIVVKPDVVRTNITVWIERKNIVKLLRIDFSAKDLLSDKRV